MLIVQGTFRVDPAERDAYLDQSLEMIRASRREHGCHEYVLAADPAEPDRVILSERWESQDDLDEHVRALTRRRAEAAPDTSRVEALSREIAVYQVASVQPMG